MSAWEPRGWRARPAAQQPAWEDAAALERTLERLRGLPPLVSVGEIESLKELLAAAARGERFVLHGGDCAERFRDCNGITVTRKLKILLQMSLVLTYGGRRPVIRIGRIAGQYAKPRSSEREVVGGRELPVFRGDNVNDLRPEPEARRPDPERLAQGYFFAAATLNYLRALVEGGFASLRSPEHWQLDFMADAGVHRSFREIADRIHDAIDYLESLGGVNESLREVDLFTSHEALLLPYEEALTRKPRSGEHWYNLGAHYLWIGERTRQLDGAHVEYARGLANPIGVKLGPSATPDEVLRLLERLDPRREPGRVTLITRHGAGRVEQLLPPMVRSVRASGWPVVWSCDPMHGNTVTVGGVKTRDFNMIVAELRAAFEAHRAEGSQLHGVHFELTGENITECIGGAEGLTAADLGRMYETGCDPRLNYAQSLEIAFVIARMLRTEGRRAEPPWDEW